MTDKLRTDRLCIMSKFDNLTLYTCSSILYFYRASESLFAFSLETLFHRQIFYEYRAHDLCEYLLVEILVADDIYMFDISCLHHNVLI